MFEVMYLAHFTVLSLTWEYISRPKWHHVHQTRASEVTFGKNVSRAFGDSHYGEEWNEEG